MSRSGYSDDYGDDDPLALGRWRSAVRNALNGRRGQTFLKETLAVLDAMPEKRLVAHEWEVPVTGMPFALKGGDVCALGAVGRAHKLDMTHLDPEDDTVVEWVAGTLNIAGAMAREMVWINDDAGPWNETPEQRWQRVRKWVESQIRN